MSKTNQETTTTPKQEAKPGFFTRMVSKIDSSMKEKAEANAQQNECCSGNDKGGKCC